MLASSTADWITAIGTAFAAVGTVGAVIIALWQTRRRDSYKVHVSCDRGVTVDENVGDLITLQATNTGERMVKLTQAYLRVDTGQLVYCPFWEPLGAGGMIMNLPKAPLPESLTDGESVTVRWQQSALDAIRRREGFDHYLYAYFTDPLGNTYEAAFPGIKAKRAGFLWKRREYVAPAEP